MVVIAVRSVVFITPEPDSGSILELFHKEFNGELLRIRSLIEEVEARPPGFKDIPSKTLRNSCRTIAIRRNKDTGKLQYKVKQQGPDGSYVKLDKNFVDIPEVV